MAELVADIDDDHVRLLALARLAIAAETSDEWQHDVHGASDKHAAACDALWRELRRQVDLEDGLVPTLQHPTVQARKLAGRMRGQIVSSVQAAIEEALDSFHFQE